MSGVSLVSGNLPKITDQLVNKDNQELTIYCYISILVVITKRYLEGKVKSYSEIILHQLIPMCKPNLYL